MTKEQYHAAIEQLYSYLEKCNVELYGGEQNREEFEGYLSEAKMHGLDTGNKAVKNFLTCIYSVGILLEKELGLEGTADIITNGSLIEELKTVNEQSKGRKLFAVTRDYRNFDTSFVPASEYRSILDSVLFGDYMEGQKFTLYDISDYEEHNLKEADKEKKPLQKQEEKKQEEKKQEEKKQEHEEALEVRQKVQEEEESGSLILKKREESAEFKEGLSILKQKLSAMSFIPQRSQESERFLQTAKNAGFDLNDKAVKNALTAAANAAALLNSFIRKNNSWVPLREKDFHENMESRKEDKGAGGIGVLKSLLWISKVSYGQIKETMTKVDASKYEELRKLSLYADELYRYVLNTDMAGLRTFDEFSKEEDQRIYEQEKARAEQEEINRQFREGIRQEAKQAEEEINKRFKKQEKEKTIVLPKTKVFTEEVREKPVTAVYTAEREEDIELPKTTVYTAEREEDIELPKTTVYTAEREEQKNEITEEKPKNETIQEEPFGMGEFGLRGIESPQEKKERLEIEDYDNTLNEIFSMLSGIEVKPVNDERFEKVLKAADESGINTDSKAFRNLLTATFSLSLYADDPAIGDDMVSVDALIDSFERISPQAGLAKQLEGIINTTLLLDGFAEIPDEYKEYNKLIHELDAKIDKCIKLEEKYKDNGGFVSYFKSKIIEADVLQHEKELAEQEERAKREEAERAKREEAEKKRQEEIKREDAEKRKKLKQAKEKKRSLDKERILAENKRKKEQEEKERREREEREKKEQEERERREREESDKEQDVSKSVDVRKMKRPVIETITEVKPLSEDELPKLTPKNEQILEMYLSRLAKNGWNHRLDRGFFTLVLTGITKPNLLARVDDHGMKEAIKRRETLDDIFRRKVPQYKISKENNRQNIMDTFWRVLHETSLGDIFEKYKESFKQIDEFNDQEKHFGYFRSGAKTSGWDHAAARHDYKDHVDNLLHALFSAKFTEEGLFYEPVSRLCEELRNTPIGSVDDFGMAISVNPRKLYEALYKIEKTLSGIPEKERSNAVSEALSQVRGFMDDFSEKDSWVVSDLKKEKPELFAKDEKKLEEAEKKPEEEAIVLPKTKVFEKELRQKPVTTVYTAERKQEPEEIPAEKKKAMDYTKKFDQLMAVKQDMLRNLVSLKEDIINQGQKDKNLYRNLANMTEEQKTEAFLKDGSVYYRRMAKALEDCIELLRSNDCHEGAIRKKFFELENRAIQYKEYNKPIFGEASYKNKSGSGRTRYYAAERFQEFSGMWRMEYSYLNRELLTISGGGKKYATDGAKSLYASELKEKHGLETKAFSPEDINAYSTVSKLRSQFVNKVANDGFKEIVRFYDHYSHNRKADAYLRLPDAPESIDRKAAWFVYKSELDRIFADGVSADEISRITSRYSPERLKAKISKLRKDKAFKDVCAKYGDKAFSKWEDIDQNTRQAEERMKDYIAEDVAQLSDHFPLNAHNLNEACETAASIIAENILAKPENAELLHSSFAGKNGEEEATKDLNMLKMVAGGYLNRKGLLKTDGSVTSKNVSEKILNNEDVQKAVIKEYETQKKAAASKKGKDNLLFDLNPAEKNIINIESNTINTEINTNLDLKKTKNTIIE